MCIRDELHQLAGEQFGVMAVDRRHAVDQLRLIIVMRERVVRVRGADLRVGPRALLFADHERDDPGQIGLKRQNLQVRHQLQVVFEHRRRTLGLLEVGQLDIDLLLVEDAILEESGLRVPHPKMHERAFVLVPMVELAPDLVHPGLGISMRAALEAETKLNGPLEGRCAILKPRSLLDEGSMSGPAGLSPG
mgnify:CR=1 FL=1